MRFIAKITGSTLLGMLGDWVGNYLGGFGTALILGFVMSIVGWYGAGWLHTRYIDSE